MCQAEAAPEAEAEAQAEAEAEAVPEAEAAGSSSCPFCGNVYTEQDIESGRVTPCIRCYKCFDGDCGVTACDCVFSDEGDEDEEGDEEEQ